MAERRILNLLVTGSSPVVTTSPNWRARVAKWIAALFFVLKETKMIIANDELFRTVMFLVDGKIVNRMIDICEFINSKKFVGIWNILKAQDADSITLRVTEDLPVIIGPEEDPEDQELILTSLYLEICPESNCAFFTMYTDEDATCRVEGGDHDVFVIDEMFASKQDITKELEIIMEEQVEHEAHTYKTAYETLTNYINSRNKTQEEFPF